MPAASIRRFSLAAGRKPFGGACGAQKRLEQAWPRFWTTFLWNGGVSPGLIGECWKPGWKNERIGWPILWKSIRGRLYPIWVKGSFSEAIMIKYAVFSYLKDWSGQGA